jgi:hypothetical protein
LLDDPYIAVNKKAIGGIAGELEDKNEKGKTDICNIGF